MVFYSFLLRQIDFRYFCLPGRRAERAPRAKRSLAFSCFNSWEASGASPTSEAITSFLLFLMFFGWFLACFCYFVFYSRVSARGGERSSPVLLALVLELIFGCLSSMPGLVSMFLYIGITCAEISYIKLGLSLAFSCSPLPDLIYHIGTCLKNFRASRSLLRQVFFSRDSNYFFDAFFSIVFG